MAASLFAARGYHANAIKDIDNDCDGKTRSIIDRLNRTFVTPLDREDIHALAISLDDVMDAIDAAAAVMRLYKIQRVRPGARRLAEIVIESMDRITEALAALEKRHGVLELAARVNQLEREADRDFYMTDDDAKKYGIIDQVYSKAK